MNNLVINVSILSGVYSNYSPYCTNSTAPWIATYSAEVNDGNIHYWVWSIDCSEIYNSSTTPELEGYEGDFYSSKIFVDGELLYDTYYSTVHYDAMKNNKDTWNLKYFTLGRCSTNSNGYWFYSKMEIYCMRLYSRGLSEEEIIENYNKTKAYYSAIIGN